MDQCPFINISKSLGFVRANGVASVLHLKKIWVLKFIVEAGSLKKAAQMTKVSPSAVSQTLSALEKIYKKPLIERKNNTIKPTKDALELLECAAPVFSSLEKLGIKLH